MIELGKPIVTDFEESTKREWLTQIVSVKRVNEIIDGFREHLTEAMVGQVSEIFDADPPHTPRGCGAQAWSVAEMLRVLTPRESNKIAGII